MFENNDTFVEDAVKVVETPAVKAKKRGLLAAAILFLLVGMSFVGPIRVVLNVLAVIFGILAIIEMTNRNIEYEYDYTNGSLEIAKIIDNSKRKSVVTIEPAQIKLVAAVGTNESLRFDHVKLKTLDCSAHSDEYKDYILVAHSEVKGNDFKVIFNPSDKLLDAMSKYNKNEVYR